MSEFEFQYRWAQIAAKGLVASVDELEARDQALEQFIKDFECGGTPSGDSFDVYSQVVDWQLNAAGEEFFTLTWTADIDFIPATFRYTLDVLFSPMDLTFGVYESGYPGPLTPFEGVSLTATATDPAGNDPHADQVSYSGTTIPSGSIVGFRITNGSGLFNLINTLQVIMTTEPLYTHASPQLSWDFS